MLRIAMIGCGRIGRVHAERIQQDPRAEVVATFDELPDAATALQRDLASAAICFSDLEALFSSANCDSAIICTPTPAHLPQVTACLNNGLHVLCEKPLSDSRENIDHMIQLAEQSTRVCQLGYQRRFWSTYRTIKRELDSGRWGKLQAVTYHTVEDWQQGIANTWRDQPEVNYGGFIGDTGSHKVDALFHLTGMSAREVFARSQTFGSRVEIVSTISALFGDERFGEESGIQIGMDLIGNAQYLEEDLHLHCEKADMMIREKTAWIVTERTVKPLTPLEPDSNPTIGFLDTILEGTPNQCPFSAAVPVFELTQAILESCRIRKNIILRTD